MRAGAEMIHRLLDKKEEEQQVSRKNANALIGYLRKAQDERKKLDDVILSPESKTAVMDEVHKKIRGIGRELKALNQQEDEE